MQLYRELSISQLYVMNNVGVRTLPCRPPFSIQNQRDLLPLISMKHRLLFNYTSIQFRKDGGVPMLRGLLMQPRNHN